MARKVKLLIALKNGDGIQWPGGKRIAVMLTFDFDAELLRHSVIGKKTIGFSDFSRGQYGPHEGLDRCLALLDRQHLPATFFIPGKIIEEYPDAVKKIADRGLEIGYHGYEHESRLGIPIEEEKENLAKAENLIVEVSGKKPTGARGPLDTLQEYSLDLFQRQGYLYDSTLKDCDWPYQLPNGIIELPTDVTLDDFTYYYFSYADSATILCSSRPDDVYVQWQDAFDELAAEGDKVMVLKFHPQLSGRVSRIHMLEKLILYMQQRGAWIADCETVANYVKDFYESRGGEQI